MTYNNLFECIKKKRSFLCVGLDSDPVLFPEHLKSLPNSIFEFNKAIVDATYEYTVAYKPNLAFYEAEGLSGWQQLQMTVDYIRAKDPEIMIIGDAKRGDIGNTAQRYAKAFFDVMGVDAVTLAPYMGKDSIAPFLDYQEKWSIILALTSNPSADDFEMIKAEGEGEPLFETVIKKSISWGSVDNTMFVVGATRPEKLAEIRSFCPDHFFLVPGVGAQGGTTEDVAKYGMNSKCGLLVNMSRGIIFADRSENFAKVAHEKAKEAAEEMSKILEKIL